MTLASIILAAGQGTRMRSKLPKVLHPLAGKPLIWHALQAVEGLVDMPPVVVVGYRAELVRQAISGRADCALQEAQLGTGQAVASAREMLEGQADTILVTFADMPFLRKTTLEALVKRHKEAAGPVTMTSFIGDEARGFGRVVRSLEGHVIAIVEQAVATPEQLAIREYNVSAYCFDAGWLWSALEQIPISPKGEYFLTDVVSLAVEAGHTVDSMVLEDLSETIGLNNRVHLATAEKVMRQRINEYWMLAGVTMIDPETTYIEADVEIGQDTVIHPNTYITGETFIGMDCEIGPDTQLKDSTIGSHVRIFGSVLEDAQVADGAVIGPYCHLRPGARLGEKVLLGNFVEVENASLGAGTAAEHFAYIADAKVGKNVLIGAGAVVVTRDVPAGSRVRGGIGNAIDKLENDG